MTRAEFKSKIEHMLNEDNGIRETILNACVSAMASKEAEGRFLSGAENDFILPKAVLSAVFAELAFQYEPIGKNNKSIVKKVKPLIRTYVG